MAGQGKTITIDNTDGGVSSVTVEQTSPDTGLNVGGVSINTDLPWYGDAFIVLILVALIYIGKKYIDKIFERKRNAK
jgi:hypothetical protein|tara:strand:- start:1074 stop:1304 length:231 start_codon:yes stop_codon:yes gene_type:complete